MNPETAHQDPEFEAKKRKYFQDFMVRHLAEARLYKQQGLLNEDGSRGWRNVARHQLLSAVMTETVAELIGIPEEQSKRLTNLSLIHDVDKRRQQEGHSKMEVIFDESKKSERPLVATGNRFEDFPNWGTEEYILRYVDSSIGEDPLHRTAGHWHSARDPENLPAVMILPWRERLAMFRSNKKEEDKTGIAIFRMPTWDKLEQIMTAIENDLFRRIVESRPELAKRYTNPSQLTQLVEDRIHEKILAS